MTIVFTKEVDDDGAYGIDPDIYKEFVNVTKITMKNVSYVHQLKVLEAINSLDEIFIEVCDDKEIIIDKLRRYSCVKEIKTMTYSSDSLAYVCTNDLIKFPKLEVVYLVLGNDDLEIQFDDLKYNSLIKKIYLSVTQIGYERNRNEIVTLRMDKERVKVSIIEEVID